MSIVGFIFARGGSKGIPFKNICPLMGKPLIGWSIEQALKVNRIERLIVSTDSNEIAEIARSFGAEVPFIRPSHLAEDNSPEWLAWRHAIEYLRDQEGYLPKTMISIPTTAPLRLPVDIENCLDEYARGLADVVITITDARRSPYFNMVTLQDDGNAKIVIPAEASYSRRQDVPVVYDITTVAYVIDTQFVLRCHSLFDGRVRAVHIPIERSLDIDTALDFRIAEALIADRMASK